MKYILYFTCVYKGVRQFSITSRWHFVNLKQLQFVVNIKLQNCIKSNILKAWKIESKNFQSWRASTVRKICQQKESGDKKGIPNQIPFATSDFLW